jgi:CRISPR-associated protein Csm1
MKETYKVALAALIHDIGKVMQRAKEPIKDRLKGQESIFCKFTKGYYSYKHSLYTAQFIEEYLNYIFDEEFLKASAKHHIPETDLEKIIARADWLSAGMDRREHEDISDEEVKRYNYINTRLYSVFRNINIGKEYNSVDYYYDLIPLEISERIFPIEEENVKRDTEYSVKEYKSLLEKIYQEFKRIDIKKPIEEIYNEIHGILERYTTFIPSSTMEYPDISLFDHLKTTAAIATCLYELHNLQENKEKEFLLLEGDVSGIQEFIFKIVEGEETKKNIAKSLRGRSVYINVLIDFVSKYIVKKLGFTISNILYCGGGKFQILLPNTNRIKEALKEIEREIQFYLYDTYKTEIGLVLAYIEIGEQGISNYAESLDKIHDKMYEAKKRKLLNIININKNNFFIRTDRPNSVCKYCHMNEGKGKEKICDECDIHIQLGGNFVTNRIKYVVYDFENEVSNSDIKIQFGKLGTVHFFNRLPQNIKAFLVENVNNTGENGRLKFVGNTVAIKTDGVASFNDIGKFSEGDNKIGVLKMDIDNLGTIFSRGLPKKNRSISRISTLSRMIGLFFSGYINKLCQDLYQEYITETKDYHQDIENIFYINYSGGDDLLLIGPWDWTMRLALKIRKKLNEFVCRNPNITLSAGIYICDSKTPIRITSEEAERYLEMAKNSEEKNAVCVYENVLNWFGINSLEKALEDSSIYKKWLSNKEISRGLIYNIMLASKNINSKNNRHDLDLIPRIAYSLSRNVSNKEIRNILLKKLITSRVEDSELEFVKIPLMVTLMKTREIKEE